MSGIEILTNGMAFELRDEDDVDGAKGFSWCTHFSGTYRVQLAFDELAVPPDAFIREQYAVHFPTGRLVRMQDGGEVQSAVVATVPPGHYHATLHCSWREESKHIGLSTSEYPESDGPDGVIVLRPEQLAVVDERGVGDAVAHGALGTVRSCSYHGHDSLLLVELAEGDEVPVRVPGGRGARPGDRVRVVVGGTGLLFTRP